MKIFYYCHVDLSGEVGSIGSVRHVLEVVNRLSERGHSVVLFAPEPRGSTDDIDTDKVRYFPDYSGYLGFFLGILVCSILMLREAIREVPDVIYTREMLYTSHNVVVAKILSIPHVTEINGFQPEEVLTDENYRSWLYPVLIVMEAINYWLSEKLLVVSEQTAKKVSRYYSIPPDRIRVIRNGVNVERCRPMNTRDCRKKVGITLDNPWVGFLGYLFPWSGVDYLVRSAPLILDRHPETRFMVIGSGTWGDHLPALAEEVGVKEQFEFTGEIPWKDVPGYLNCLDIGVSPYTSERDTLDSLKTYEYMACGLPVVVADIPEVNKIVKETEAGLVFEPENTEDLAGKILALLDDRSRMDKCGRNGREAVEKEYNWDTSVDKTESILRGIVKTTS